MRTIIVTPPAVGRAVLQSRTGVCIARRDAADTAQPNDSHRCRFVRCGAIA